MLLPRTDPISRIAVGAAPVNAQVRALLGSLPTDAEFEAFCLDHFPSVYRNFSAGMDRTQRTTLLLQLCGAAAITTAWQTRTASHAAPGQPPVFQLAPTLSPYFTGRKEVLARLRQQLGEHRLVVLCGLGGVGKTQTAVAYAHRYRSDYPVVLWLAGDSVANFEQGLFALGPQLARSGRLPLPFVDECEPAAVRQAVLDYLRYDTDYLLICDNVDAPHAIKAVWPGRARLGGQVLMTSRSSDSRRLGAVVVELDKLPETESAAYLAACHPADSAEERQALGALAEELDGLPLALSQAAAFLTEHQSRYTSYLRQYRKQKLGLLEQSLPDDYPSSVATTWAMNIEQMQKTSAASSELLQLCALLHPNAIPEELFSAPVAALGGALGTAGALVNDQDALAFDRLLKPLLSHALVHRNRDHGHLSVHRLVQQAVLYRLPEAEQRRLAAVLLVQLDSVFPEPTFRHWPACRRLLPQVMALVEHLERFALTDLIAARLLYNAGHFLNSQAAYADASQLCQRALLIREQALGEHHLEVANSLKGLGVVRKNQGQLAEAELLFRRALAIREQALGVEHPDVADSLNFLGLLLKRQGRPADAELLHRRALRLIENALGAEHLQVAYCLNNLVSALRRQGQLAETESLCRRALRIFEGALDREHPTIAYGLHGLGLVLAGLGRLAEAEPLYRRALTIREQALPQGHPGIKAIRVELAEILTALKRTSTV